MKKNSSKTVSHAERPAKAKSQPEMAEIAAHAKDADIVTGFVGRVLPNPDRIVSKESPYDGVRVYDKLLQDPHVECTTQVRAAAVVSREFTVEPGDESPLAQKIADFVGNVFRQIALFDQFRKLTLGRGTVIGFSPAEIMWEYSEGDIWIDRIYHRKEYRFVFDKNSQPRLITLANMIEGEELPERKFYLYNYPGTDNPYGDGLGQKLYWWEFFKRHDIKNWVQFNERFGDPTAIGQYPRGSANPTDVTKLENTLAKGIQKQASIVVPDDVVIKLLEAERTGSITSFEKQAEFCDRQISKAVLGQTLTTEPGNSGSYSLGQVHNQVRGDILKGDADLQAYAINAQIVKWLVDFNFGPQPKKHYPQFWIQTEEGEDLDKRLERDERAQKMGYPITLNYMQETYGYPEAGPGDVVMEAKAASAPMPTFPGDAVFAEAADPEVKKAQKSQAQIDHLINSATEMSAPIFNDYSAWIQKAVLSADTLESFNDSIFELYPVIPTDPLFNLLAAAMDIAEDLGRDSISLKFAEISTKEKFIFPEAKEYLARRAFTIAGVTKADLLLEIKNEVIKAMDEGQRVRDFANNLPQIFEKHGYQGLSPHRIHTIYQTNIQSAYQAGRYRRMTAPDVIEARPYWRYVTVLDASTRPEHAQLNGKIFPANHPFWDRWYPPNGYGCRCTVVSVSPDEMRHYGWQIESDDPTGKLFEPMDAEGNKLPARALMPDPGWSRNAAKRFWEPKLNKYPEELRQKIEAENQAFTLIDDAGKFIGIRNNLPLQRRPFITPYNAQEYLKLRASLYLSLDEQSGYALTGDKDLISVFSLNKSGALIMKNAIENGAETLDVIGIDKLVNFYKKYGFAEYKRIPWDDKYAPEGWDYEAFGRPDIVFMRRKKTGED